jgi:hypothetical protein
MSMTYPGEDDLRLDDRLDELSASIVARIDIEPPEVKAKLGPSQLKVVKGVAHGLNNYCVPKADGTKIILVGADLYSFFLQYTRAAAAYFLPSEPGGPRPSPFFPRACSALATTLDWISSPTSAPVYPQFDLSPQQEHVAHAFAAFAYRFALCHEMAHIVLEHVDVSPAELQKVRDADVSVLGVSQRQELEADRFGLQLQINSLLDNTQLVTALASAVYFVHITGLIDGRLMLLAHLVDHTKWKIAYTHPPALQRVLNLMGAAQRYGDKDGAGMQSVHGSLAGLDGLIYDAANKQQQDVTNETESLLEKEFTNSTTALAVPSNLGPPVVSALLQLFERSPLGVMRALEPQVIHVSAASDRTEAMPYLLREQFAAALPPEFRRFRGLTRAQRAQEIA